jgi:NDP-sugar pyrophosphorylase family protein
VEIAGLTLLDHVFRQYHEAGIDQVSVVIRSDDTQLNDYVRQNTQFSGGLQIVQISPGGGTGASLHALVNEMGQNSCLISTADTIARPGAYRRFLDYATSLSTETVAVVMGTSYVRDEDPIWIVSDGEQNVLRMSKGIQPSGIVFGNVRWLSAACCEEIASMTIDHSQRDMSIMAALLQNPNMVIKVFVEDPVFDIDDPGDLSEASSWLEKNSFS